MTRRLIPFLLVPLAGVLIATTSFADDRQRPATSSAAKPFGGPRWKQPEPARAGTASRARDEAQWTIDVRAVDRSGDPAAGVSYSLYDLETAEQVVFGRTGQDTPVRLPAGRYSGYALVLTRGDDTPPTRTMVLLPEVTVSADTAVVFDARAGRRVSAELDEPKAAQVSAAVFVYQSARNGKQIRHGVSSESFADGIYVTPTPRRPELTTYVYTVWTRPDLPDVYNLMSRSPGQVPSRLSYRYRTADLAAVRVRYAAQAVDSCGGAYIGPYLAGKKAALSYGRYFPLPTRRTEYYTPDETHDVAWYTEFAQTTADCSFEAYDTQTGVPVRYPRPGPSTAAWNTAPLAPSTATDADGRPTAVREGDVMSVRVPMYVDSQPGRTDLGEPYTAATGSIALFAGERLIAGSPTLDSLTGEVPPEPATYRLRAVAERRVGWSALATRTATSWTFRSGPGGERTALPLINARYRLTLDDHNRAPADVPVPLAVEFEHPIPIVRTRLFVSDDDGGTWQSVALTGSGPRRYATLRHKAGESVSLRLEAGDSAGNSIDQTLVRAYLTS
jgi:hypothetical protein